MERIAAALAARSQGGPTVSYRLRDWGISRQRYWGAPIPIIYCARCGMLPVPERDLPVVLPEDVVLTGTGGSPLAAHAAFVCAACPRCGGAARRETDTMDTFVESSWYFARYCSPRHDAAPFDPAELDYWLGAEGVERYIGGIEHAVLHLLYARFFTKVLRDLGFLRLDEPFRDLLTQGMVIKDGAKMSKSKGNVVDPDYLVERYGADTARLFCLFQAPPEKDLDWSDQGVEGMHRFLHRLWRLVHGLAPRLAAPGTPLPAPLSADDRELHRRTHETIHRVSDDVVERLHFNTAVAAVMELVNALGDASEGASPAVLREAIDATLLLLAPFVPHIVSELWEAAGHARALDAERWPAADPGALARELIELPVQVNGKLRGRVTLPADAGEAQAVAMALADAHIQANGGYPTSKGYKGFPAALCISPNAMVVHGIPDDYRAQEGDLISVDLGVTLDGLVADSAITLPVGEISPEAHRLLDVCREALGAGIEQARVGNRLSDISHAVQVVVEGAGFSVIRSLVGHGVGRSYHEDPQIPNFGAPGRGPELLPGMTLAIEPMITAGGPDVVMHADEWSISSVDESLAAHFEHTVAITAGGPRVLTTAKAALLR